ncbi:MAG: hypothetical protein KDA75_19950, partial [Planctomycetaceae bacterium]|nr:hypothetical protein [Planctomycetaceae bacterium]
MEHHLQAQRDFFRRLAAAIAALDLTTELDGDLLHALEQESLRLREESRRLVVQIEARGGAGGTSWSGGT